MAQENEYISDAAETMFRTSQDIKIRSYCEAVEEARRLRRGLEIRVERAEAALQAALQGKNEELQAKDNELQAKDNELQAKDNELQAKDNELQVANETLRQHEAEIARLKALLANQ